MTDGDDTETRRQEVEHFFSEYVTWMRSDIAREVSWVRTVKPRSRREWIVRYVLRRPPRGAGNLLCALGLLVYTEALGRVWRWNLGTDDFYTPDGRERPGANFETAFDRLDAGSYGTWRTRLLIEAKISIYEALRSGLVHEYRPKIGADMHLGFDESRGVDYRDGRLKFFVVPYYEHFCGLADAFRAEILALEEPSLPVPYFRPPRRSDVEPSGPGSVSGSTN